MDSSKQGYINYRIEKAKEVLQDAQILINEERWNSAVNRLYYATFHAVQALLLKNNLSAKTHNGTKSIFFQYFIKTGLLNKTQIERFSLTIKKL